jgi:hypothetical protein
MSANFSVIRETFEFFAFVRYWRKLETDEAVFHLFMDFKKACHLIKTEMLFNIHVEFGIPVKQVR